MNLLETLLFVAGFLHFSILLASGLVPRVLNWRSELARLPELSRQLIWVHGAYIVLMIIGFGMVSVCLPGELAAGTVLSRAVCGFITLFWGGRLAIQLLYFRPGPCLKSAALRIGYNALTLLFVYFTAVYGASALGAGG
jgi:hypothetical protein